MIAFARKPAAKRLPVNRLSRNDVVIFTTHGGCVYRGYFVHCRRDVGAAWIVIQEQRGGRPFAIALESIDWDRSWRVRWAGKRHVRVEV